MLLKIIAGSKTQVSGYATFSQRSLLRAPLWRGKKDLGSEALQAAAALKLAKRDSKALQEVLASKVGRLVKLDLLALLHALQRHDEVDLAFQVFERARKEVWYKPSVPLYRDMLKSLARNGRVEGVYSLFETIKQEKAEPHIAMFTEVIDIFVGSGRFRDALKVFEMMKESEAPPNVRTYRTIINCLNKQDQFELSAKIERELKVYVEKTFGRDGVPPCSQPVPRCNRVRPSYVTTFVRGEYLY
ncbi:protein THYLAKOID ASSEMBLY 8-like, chloroplastic [Selaginella moellendorffii]|uniref:protein THYLAKOID ASSEMBLY 8-like, chloroplastic n=1 Tax=Selaginella moellendorffii TaxID=88036 RepID=UPI000D1CE87E|nr:protein THYLAKOID ASSEMBLY 8-like, chloroplastic [Selaginella moellendorffii]|eukprot:XP_024529177.1 protein THYLAKOID ASSEMBLY 8-like, chloroplastic [Selaginella moellendorffii]